jgi:hypothetical protein
VDYTRLGALFGIAVLLIGIPVVFFLRGRGAVSAAKRP